MTLGNDPFVYLYICCELTLLCLTFIGYNFQLVIALCAPVTMKSSTALTNNTTTSNTFPFCWNLWHVLSLWGCTIYRVTLTFQSKHFSMWARVQLLDNHTKQNGIELYTVSENSMLFLILIWFTLTTTMNVNLGESSAVLCSYMMTEYVSNMLEEIRVLSSGICLLASSLCVWSGDVSGVLACACV